MLAQSRPLRRAIARERTSDENRSANKPSALHWPNVNIMYSEWMHFCKGTIQRMKVCGHCGFTSFGNSSSEYKFKVMRIKPPTVAPYGYCNAFLLPYIHIDSERYYICDRCVANKDRGQILVFMSPAYIRAILKAKPLYLQLLSLVDCRLGIINKFNGFHVGFVRGESLLDSPLVCWNMDTLQCSNVSSIMEEVYEVFATNLVINKLFKRYLCLLETPDPSLGVSVLTGDVVQHIVQRQQEKGIATYSMTVNPYEVDIHILQDVSYTIPVSRKRKYESFDSGNMYSRSSLLLREPMITNVEGISIERDVTLETTMFPFLFPHQKGHYNGDIGFAEYLKRRMHQFFSPFTLYKPYLLISYQLRQSIQLASMTKTCILDKEYATLKKMQPNLSEEEVFRLMIKQNISYTVPGSPAWHSKHLKDLLCMVQRWGLPTFFLTLTSDEVSETRWAEIHDIESLAKSFNNKHTWKDCPIECAALFHHRVQTFLKKYVFCGDDGVLGKIEEHVTRYELQGRGSLHSHTALWCRASDVDRVTSEICCYIPAEFDNKIGQFNENISDPMNKLLYKYVVTKQIHHCKEGICLRQNGPNGLHYCKLGFPHDDHPSKTPSVHPVTGKWEYYRPGREHRNVVAYHPVLLLLWGAHMNIQRVTNEAWSFYLLKYALKCEPIGSLNLNIENAKVLGLEGLTEMQLKLVSGAVMSRSICATEAALTCLQISTIHRSSSVLFIDSSPPDKRTSLYRKASVLCLHPTQTYALRPRNLSHVTFYEYFENYEVLKDGDLDTVSTNIVGKDFQGNAVVACRRLVRFSDFHPVHHCQQFFYNLLLRHVHFRSEAELLSRTDSQWSYLHECISRHIVSCMEDIESLISEYALAHLYSNVHKGEMIEKIRARIPSAVWQEGANAIFGHAIAPHQIQPIPMPRHVELGLNDALARLTNDQYAVFQQLKDARHGVHMLTGSPGSGKSFLITILHRYWLQAEKVVLLAATTGIAAMRMDATASTVHQTFRIPVKGPLQPLHRSCDVFDSLSAANIIVIDECSMLTPKIFNAISSRLHEVSQGENRNHNPFSTKMLLLVGDMCQLPPVCTHVSKKICMRCHLSSHPSYKLFHRYHLTTVLRQASDVEFLTFLNSIRETIPTQEAINACLGICFVTEMAGYEFIDKSTTIICSHRNSVAKYNAICLLNYFHPDHIVEVPISTNASEDSEQQAWLACPKFHELSHVAIGCKVLLTETLDLQSQAVNGATGEVVDLIYKEEELQSILVRLESNGITMTVMRSCTQYRRSRHLISYKKSTFPLMLAYAMTGHKSQGASINSKVLMVITEAFAHGLTYVMLSRVTNRKNLRIIGSLHPSDFESQSQYRMAKQNRGAKATLPGSESCPLDVGGEPSFQSPLKDARPTMDEFLSPCTKKPRQTTPSSTEFLRMILEDIKDDAEEIKKPTLRQIEYADSLGLEMSEWEDGSIQRMSRLIDQKREWHRDFRSRFNEYPATGLVKECLRLKGVEFDEETLARKQSIILLKSISRGATVQTMKELRYSFNVSVDILLGLTETQAQKVLTRMKAERDAGRLSDLQANSAQPPNRRLSFDNGPSTNVHGGLTLDETSNKRKASTTK